MELRFLSHRIPYEPRINPRPLLLMVKKAFTELTRLKLFCFERYGMVEDMPERQIIETRLMLMRKV